MVPGPEWPRIRGGALTAAHYVATLAAASSAKTRRAEGSLRSAATTHQREGAPVISLVPSIAQTNGR